MDEKTEPTLMAKIIRNKVEVKKKPRIQINTKIWMKTLLLELKLIIAVTFNYRNEEVELFSCQLILLQFSYIIIPLYFWIIKLPDTGP